MLKSEPTGPSRPLQPSNQNDILAGRIIANTTASTFHPMNLHPSSSHQGPSSSSRFIPFTPEEKIRLTSDLSKFLAPDYTATRPGPGRTSLTYIEAWRIKNLANTLFGFDGWSSAISDVTDIGCGSSEGQRSKAASLEKAKKEATTDALKRALTSYGNLLGNCLYNKNYCRYLSTQRSERPQFDAKDIYVDPSKVSAPVPSFTRQQPQQQPTASSSVNSGHSNGSPAFGGGPSTGNPYKFNFNAAQNNSASNASGPSSSTTGPVHHPPMTGHVGSASAMETNNSSSNTVKTAPMNHMNKSIKKEDEEDDDLFFGADIEDSKVFQVESPRMTDFELEEVMADMLTADSPVKAKPETSSLRDSLPASPRRTLSRVASSPSMVQTTPTKSTAITPSFAAQRQQPVPFKGFAGSTTLAGTSSTTMSKPVFTSMSGSNATTTSVSGTSSGSPSGPPGPSRPYPHKENPFVSKQSPQQQLSSPPSSVSIASSGGSTSNGSMAPTPPPGQTSGSTTRGPQQHQQQPQGYGGNNNFLSHGSNPAHWASKGSNGGVSTGMHATRGGPVAAAGNGSGSNTGGHVNVLRANSMAASNMQQGSARAAAIPIMLQANSGPSTGLKRPFNGNSVTSDSYSNSTFKEARLQ
ncbi:DNA repair protein rad52 [Lunasporangiospora selenospora]|uniref:DNA repair protein rad52 n=1 Tax=Lunasporangiospora selenospora TaxID=979761 RepID=A0A9P6FWV1_9FUNG|nr:DNA repair protein rad52 [Lunasporangiospora selenospora]